jgi:hypothetical protein
MKLLTRELFSEAGFVAEKVQLPPDENCKHHYKINARLIGPFMRIVADFRSKQEFEKGQEVVLEGVRTRFLNLPVPGSQRFSKITAALQSA